MAQVDCQLVHRAGRLSVLWSSGTAAFEPIHFEGDALAGFEQAARKARQTLAAAGLGDAAADAALPALGRDLFERFFAAGVGAEVANWLRSLDSIESFEIGSDLPGQIPFAIFEDPQSPGAWGRRYPLAVGRRLNPLRNFGEIALPSVLAVVDPDLRSQLPEASAQALDAFVAAERTSVATSRLQLMEALEESVADVIWILARLEGGAWIIAGERLTPLELAAAIRKATAGNTLPVVVNTAIGGLESTASWECFLSSATAALPGIIGLETPAPATAACDIGLSFLKLFLDERQPAAKALQQVRLAAGQLGLAFSAFTPPLVRIIAEGDDEGGPPARPLPEEPYRPFRPLEREERALLFGRDDDIQRCAVLLDQPNASGLLIHGGAGVGKASFVRAGLLPFLEEENRGFFVLRDRSDEVAPEDELEQPTLALRAGPDVVGSLALGLTAFAARPFVFVTPTGRTVAVDLPQILRQFLSGAGDVEAAIQPSPAGSAPPTLAVQPSNVWDHVEQTPSSFAELVERLTADLPFELVIPLEQLDDAVALPSAKDHAELAAAVFQGLARSSGRFALVATLRTEFLGQIHTLLGQDNARYGWKEYFLSPPTETALKDALLAPSAIDQSAYSSDTAAAKYAFGFEPSAAAQILRHVLAQEKLAHAAPMQLVHAIGSKLYDAAKRRGGQSARAGDIKSALSGDVNAELVEGIVKRLPIPSSTLKAFRRLLPQLSRNSGGVVTRNLLDVETLEANWRSAVPLERVLELGAETGPLVETQTFLVGGKEATYVAPPSNALASLADQNVLSPAARKQVRSKIVDFLFIAIPLALLGMSLTFFVTRRLAASGKGAQTGDKAETDLRSAEIKGRYAGGLANRFALYSGLLAQAESCLQQGNTLRARQLLVAQQAPANANDIRGFEWFQMWKSINLQDATLVGHEAQARVLAMSADGKALVSGDEGGQVYLWSLDDLKEPLVARLKGLTGPVQALAIAADGSTIAASDGGSKIAIWDAVKLGKTVVNVEPKTTLTTESKKILSLAFVGDGKIALGDEDKNVILYGIADGKAEWTATGHTAPVTAVVTLGKSIVSGSDREVISWTGDGKKDKSESLVEGFRLGGLAPADGSVVVAGGINDKGSVFTWTPGKKVEPLSGPFSPNLAAVAVVPDAKLVAVGGSDQTLRIVAKDEKNSRRLLGHITSIRSLAAGGSRLASLGFDNAIKVWSSSTILAPELVPTNAPIVGLALDAQERILASANADGAIAFWDPANGKKIGGVKAAGPVAAIAFSSKEASLTLAAAVGNDVAVWEVTLEKDGVKTKELPGLKKHTEAITCLSFSKDSPNMLASGSRDKSVIVWDVTKADATKILKHPETPRSLLFSTALLFTGDDVGVVRAFNPGSGNLVLPPFKVHFAAVTGLGEISGNQNLVIVISASADQTVRIWGTDLKAQQYGAFQVYHAHHQPVTALAQGKGFFVSGAADGAVKTWDPTLPDERFTYSKHTGPVRALLVGKNNDFVISGGADGDIVFHRGVPRPMIGPANQAAGDDEE